VFKMERSTLSSARDRIRDTATNGLSTAVSTAKDRLPDRLSRKKREREMARKRGFMLAGLLAMGAALGAVGALVARRRRQHSWEEYEPAPAETVAPDGDSTTAEMASTPEAPSRNSRP
jgi:hypothetical protein